jgi:hypothetical protein
MTTAAPTPNPLPNMRVSSREKTATMTKPGREMRRIQLVAAA